MYFEKISVLMLNATANLNHLLIFLTYIPIVKYLHIPVSFPVITLRIDFFYYIARNFK